MVGALTCFDSRGLQRADSTLFREERRPSTHGHAGPASHHSTQSRPRPLSPARPSPAHFSHSHSLLFPVQSPCPLFLSQVYAPNSHRQQFPPRLLTVFVWQAGRQTVRHAEHGSTTFPSPIHVHTSSAIWQKRRPRRHPRSMTLFCMVTDGAGGSEKMMLALCLDSLLVPSRSTRSGQGHVASAGLMHFPPTTAVRP